MGSSRPLRSEMVPCRWIPSRWYIVGRMSFGETGRSVGVAAVASDAPTTLPRAMPPPAKQSEYTCDQWSRPPPAAVIQASVSKSRPAEASSNGGSAPSAAKRDRSLPTLGCRSVPNFAPGLFVKE